MSVLSGSLDNAACRDIIGAALSRMKRGLHAIFPSPVLIFANIVIISLFSFYRME